ncbi:MAG: hypothetical protein ABW252_07135 [Polyangiales bacterium]
MKMRRGASRPALAAFAGVLAVAGCAQLQSVLNAAVQLVPPQVALQEVALAQTPSQQSLRAYFCPRVLSEQLSLGGTASNLLCSQFFGAAPAADALKVAFDVRLNVKNPNRVPLPLSSILTAVNVYPGQQGSELGAACASLCSPEDPACGAKDANACPSTATDITNRAEIAQALGKMVIAEGARLATGQTLGVKAPEVLADQSLDLVVRLSLDPMRLLPVMQQFAKQAVNELKQGKAVNFAIPYQLNGNVFTGAMGSAGTLTAPFGPIDGNWTPAN